MSIDISEIEKGLYHAWSDYEYKEGNLYSTTFRDGWLMGIEFYKKKLESRKNDPLVISEDGVSVDLNNYTATYKDIKVKLPRKEAFLLHFMMVNKHRSFTRKELIDKLWPTDIIVEERTVDVHLCKIRERLKLKDFLINIKGIGFIWKR